MNKEITSDLLKKEGKFIDGGRERDVFSYKGKVYKLAEKYPQQNAKEYYKYLIGKNNDLYNPILDINFDSTIIEVEECTNMTEFILEKFNLDKSKYRSLKFELSEIDSIFAVAKKFKLEEYLDVEEKDIRNFCDKNKHDLMEILYPLNWGYNKRLNKLVILDYAD